MQRDRDGGLSMSEESAMRKLFDRWERVRPEVQYDLIHDCMASVYIRHDESGPRSVANDESGKTGEPTSPVATN